MRCGRVAAVVAVCLSVGGCIPQYVVPEPLDSQINRTVSFAQLRQSADQFKGATVVLGGVVLNAKNLPEGTEIEVLQVPLVAYDRPEGPVEASEGRFLVIDPERRDPAVLGNRRITVVGTVIGTKVLTVDQFEYPFPYLSARFIQVWGSPNGYVAPYPYYYYPSYPYYYYPYYPSFYLGLGPFWYGPSGGYHGAPPPPPRSFGAPPGGGPSGPSGPGGPGGGPSGGPGGGGGRRFN